MIDFHVYSDEQIENEYPFIFFCPGFNFPKGFDVCLKENFSSDDFKFSLFGIRFKKKEHCDFFTLLFEI